VTLHSGHGTYLPMSQVGAKRHSRRGNADRGADNHLLLVEVPFGRIRSKLAFAFAHPDPWNVAAPSPDACNRPRFHARGLHAAPGRV